MRVIAGKYRSRPLRSLRGMDIRPTSDRLRETLFDVLTAGKPKVLEGTIWLDLYAGTGAVGIEAISRGAAMVHFVESSRAAAGLISENLCSLDIQTGFQIVNKTVGRALHALEEHSVAADFVLLDPPYRMDDEYQSTLELLGNTKLIKPSTVVIAEHQKKVRLAETVGRLHKYRLLEQGDAALSFYKA